MATQNFVPRADGEGGVGTALKNWLNVFTKNLIINGDRLTGKATAADVIDGTSDAKIVTPLMMENKLTARTPRALSLTWAQIQSKIQSGDFSGIEVGDYKDVTLTNSVVMRMVVAGINTYTGAGYGSAANGGIPNHIDFISRDCYPATHGYNSTDNNNGNATYANPFMASELYSWLNGTVYSYLPSDLQAVTANKSCLMPTRYAAGSTLTDDNSWAWFTPGKLWLPSEVEVFGFPVWGNKTLGAGGGGCNKQYEIFRKYPEQLIKHTAYNGTARAAWWLSSAYAGSSAYFCIAGGDGGAGGTTASSAGLFAPVCFRVM